MDFYIAFDKNSNTEFLLYRDMIHKNKTDELDEIYYSEPVFKCKVMPIGTFLLNFLNTNFCNFDEYFVWIVPPGFW